MLKAREKGLGIHDSPSVEAVDDIPEESLADDTAPDNGGIGTSTVEEENNESNEETREPYRTTPINVIQQVLLISSWELSINNISRKKGGSQRKAIIC